MEEEIIKETNEIREISDEDMEDVSGRSGFLYRLKNRLKPLLEWMGISTKQVK